MRRRQLIVGAMGSFLAACWGVVSKDKSDSEERDPEDTAPEVATEDAPPELEDCDPQDLVISLAEYPKLREVGQSSIISFPEQFVHILVVCIAEEHWIAVWKICTHGNCDVEWDDEMAAVRCPCHDSLFDTDGTVIQGPAVTGLKSFIVCRDEEQLFVRPA